MFGEIALLRRREAIEGGSLGGREDREWRGRGAQEGGQKDRSDDYLSAPDPSLDTQGPILSPDVVLHLLSQHTWPSQHSTKVAFRLLNLSSYSIGVSFLSFLSRWYPDHLS